MQESHSAKSSFVCVYRPADQGQLMMIKMLLEGKNLNYYVEDEESNKYATPGIPMRVMVEMGRAEEIKKALRDELGLK